MSVQEEMSALEAADGFRLGAFVARADGGAKGGIVILQEIFGVTDQLKAVARSWAADGYDAIVPAMFDRTTPNTVVPFDEAPTGRDIALNLDPAKVQLDAEAARAAVDSGRSVSLIGFCLGGGQAAAPRLPARADGRRRVLRHGPGEAPGELSRRAPVPYAVSLW